MSVEFYNNNSDTFFSSTINSPMDELYNLFEKDLSLNGEILDLGCGSGRDSKYFLNKGYEVTAIDLSENLAKKASEYINQKVIIMNMLDIDYFDKYCGVWACASLLHLSEKEINFMLEKIYKALKSNGIFYASFKYGEFHYEKDGRTFTCFTEKTIKTLDNISFFSRYDFFITTDVRENRNNEKWLNIILKK